ncbi:adhesion G-protein coupled receptor G5 isoform X3 [Centrocercus urophasianus]|uniref:adhesion G-protein coupled receptor G5 isoform X3 n=1 Tax=Centrocercus urophasianus TaxID=9002 RepID=UPI001C64D5F5|nr:adhesion G-protein coupled receptor G5 isoform X3 [Centrocercus urophasianus]
MPTLLLTALVLCLAEPVLPNQDTEYIQSCMHNLSEGLKQGSSRHNWASRLTELERALAHSTLGKEEYSFKTNILEAFVFNITAGSFRGLNVSSNMDEHNSSVLNDHILGAFLHNRRVGWLRRPVEIRFGHNEQLDSSNATCVFWQPAGTGSAGTWSREGCETQHQKGTVRCLCNHLTYFAVLLIQAHNLSESELQSLTYISTVGCSISATAAFCTLLLCCVFRCRPRDDTTRIHMNLLAALLLLNTSFLLSEPLAAGTMEGCQAAAALLHGSLLCALGWMWAEGFHLYLLLIKVYNIYVRHYLLKLCLCTWGLPTLAVLAVLIFKREIYGHHIISTADGYKNMTMCWLTSPPAHYMTLCYAGLILLFNVLVLVAVVVVLWKTRQQQRRARRDWVTVLGLTCLLGTTWGTAFCAFGVLLVPQLYLFTVLNSLQGVFLCLWYLSTHRSKRSTSDCSASR